MEFQQKIIIAQRTNLGYYNLTSILPEGDAMDTTRLSERGLIVIPKRVREAHGWKPGLEFVVEDTGDSIRLKPIQPFKRTTIEEVRGCLHYKGPRKSLKDMEAAIAKGAKESKKLPLIPGLSNVKMEDPQTMIVAISWYGDGLDLADALHLASSREAEKFATFDKSLFRKAGQLSSVHLIAP